MFYFSKPFFFEHVLYKTYLSRVFFSAWISASLSLLSTFMCTWNFDLNMYVFMDVYVTHTYNATNFYVMFGLASSMTKLEGKYFDIDIHAYGIRTR